MIIGQNTTEISGDLVFQETIKMQIADDANALIIRRLTNLYSNPYLACLREYTSNAYDSHLRAGQTRPVAVSLPSALSPNLIIEDWGVGMSREELRAYGQYGSTTKNKSNTEVGGFGLGSKSGLAICPQFQVRAVKDGFRNTVVIGFDKSGAPSMGFMSAEPQPTDEPNGVRVSIPNTDRDRFVRAIAEGFFIGWALGSITVDGHQPEVSVHDTEHFTESKLGWISTSTASRGNGARALVGPVVYRLDLNAAGVTVPYKLKEGLISRSIIDLPIGSVELTPSREELLYTAGTRAAIRSKIEVVIEDAKREIEDSIAQAESIRDALKIQEKARREGFDIAYSYKGTSLALREYRYGVHPGYFTISSASWAGTRKDGSAKYISNKSTSYISKFSYNMPNVLHDDKTILVVNAGPLALKRNGTSSGIHAIASLVAMYAQSVAAQESTSPDDYRYYMTNLTKDELDPVIVGSFAKVIDGADFTAEAEKFKRAALAAARKNRKRAVPVAVADMPVRRLNYSSNRGSSSTELTLGMLDATKTYIILKSGESDQMDLVRRTLMFEKGQRENPDLAAALRLIFATGKYIGLSANKSWAVTKYAQLLPNIVTLKDAMQQELTAALALITPAQALAARDSEVNDYHWVRYIGNDLFDNVVNEETRAWLHAMRSRSGAAQYAKAKELLKLAPIFGVDVSNLTLGVPEQSPGMAYPLLDHLDYNTKPDLIVDYINLVDASRKTVVQEVEEETAA